MNTLTNKGLAYICYGKINGTIMYGSFDEVPMDSYLGIINLQMPYINENGDVKYKEYIHRIFCGEDIPVKEFLEIYGNSLNNDQIENIRLNIKNGLKTIILPLDFNNSTEFSFLREEDRLCKSRIEFENIIAEFKDQTKDILELLSPDDVTISNKM